MLADFIASQGSGLSGDSPKHGGPGRIGIATVEDNIMPDKKALRKMSVKVSLP